MTGLELAERLSAIADWMDERLDDEEYDRPAGCASGVMQLRELARVRRPERCVMTRARWYDLAFAVVLAAGAAAAAYFTAVHPWRPGRGSARWPPVPAAGTRTVQPAVVSGLGRAGAGGWSWSVFPWPFCRR